MPTMDVCLKCNRLFDGVSCLFCAIPKNTPTKQRSTLLGRLLGDLGLKDLEEIEITQTESPQEKVSKDTDTNILLFPKRKIQAASLLSTTKKAARSLERPFILQT